MPSRILFIIAVITITFSGVVSAEQTTSVYMIRHAEKNLDVEQQDPELTEEGQARARGWAKVFLDVEFDAIYSTDTKRTQATASPVAMAQNLEVITYHPFDINLDALMQEHAGQTLLLVGHSNTIPHIANKLIQEQRYIDMDEGDYGSLFIVTLTDSARQSQRLFIQ